MLNSLHVKNLALIEEEEVAFSDGLNILTGETGAGKSIIIGSVNLALGAKADKGIIRTGAEYALIELVFSLDNEEQRQKLQEMGLEPEDDGTILIKRRIYPGRSQCTVQGETVTAKELRELGELLIDIYGQRENQRLLRRQAQLGVIDEYAGAEDAALLGEVKEHYRSWSEKKRQYESDNLDKAAQKRELDLLSYEINEMESAALKKGEDAELELRYRKLSSFRKIDEALQTAGQLIGGDGSDGSSASEQVGRALRSLSQVQGIDPALDSLIGQLGDLDSMMSDASRAVSDYMEGLSFDPQEFQEIEERLDLINHLKDKYGNSLEQIEEALASRKKRFEALSDYDAGRERLRKETEGEYRALLDACRKLSDVRRRAADDFTGKMTGELLDLNFNQVDFRVSMTSGEEKLCSDGFDEVRFYISMNPGEPPRPLEDVASGGELSRIMLALKTVFAGKDDIHTFIFDEIDSGISGQTAWKVAAKLGHLSKNHQILCITHLPQIAAMEQRHFLIAKETDGTRTATHIRPLDEEESVRELGRMMGGEEITEITLQNAREMKAMARKTMQA